MTVDKRTDPSIVRVKLLILLSWIGMNVNVTDGIKTFDGMLMSANDALIAIISACVLLNAVSVSVLSGIAP